MVNVEKRATLAVEDVLSRCSHLVGFIDSNDKTPITDGFIQIYRGLSRKNEETIGRVDVQIKGRTVPQKLAPGSFPMTRIDLETVRRHGTILLLVVFVRPDGSYIGGPKYAILAPYTVAGYLIEMKRNARSFSIPLRDLPTDLAEVESIVHIAYRTKAQSHFPGSGRGILERSTEITISSTRDLDFTEPVIISARTGDFVVEVKTPEGLVVPLGGEIQIFPASYSETAFAATVRCGPSAYTTATTRQVGPDKFELKLSDGLTLTHTFEDGRLQYCSASLQLVPNLLERIRDIDFFLAMADGSPLYLDDNELVSENISKGNHEDLEAVRARLGRLVRLLVFLHVDCRLIDVDAIDEYQRKQLGYLDGALFKGHRVKAEDTEATAALVSSEIGQWRLYMLLLPHPDGAGGVAVDPFDPANRDRFRLYRTDESGNPVEANATVYDMLDREEFPLVLNLNLGSIVDAYELIAAEPSANWLANRTMLRLTHAADDCKPRRDEFLNAADALNEWIASREEPSARTTLNRYQIKARRPCGLTEDDRTAIRAVRRTLLRSDTEDAIMGEAGCAILLGETEELSDCLARLPQETQDELRGYPIWSLRERTLTSEHA